MSSHSGRVLNRKNEERAFNMPNSSDFSILFITREKYPSSRVDLADLFSRGIVKHGVRIDWVMQAAQPSLSKVLENGKYERVFLGRAVSGNGVLSKAVNNFLGLIHDLNIWRLGYTGMYQFIQVRDKFLAGTIALLTARVFRTYFTYWMSYPFPEADLYRASNLGRHLSKLLRIFYSLRGHLTKLMLYRFILPNADHVFVQSKQMKDSLVARNIDPNKVTAIPMGVAFTRLHKSNIIPSRDVRLLGRFPVVYIGSLARTRKIDFMIEAFRLVNKRVPQSLLVLVGNASDSDIHFLNREVELRGLQNHVVITGFLEQEEVWTYVLAAKVCVSPIPPNPIYEAASPTKVIEYMALAKPVIASIQPDQRKLIEESGCGIVVPYEVNKFAESIIAVLNDPESARLMGERGLKYALKHRSYQTLSKELNTTYRTLLLYHDPTT